MAVEPGVSTLTEGGKHVFQHAERFLSCDPARRLDVSVNEADVESLLFRTLESTTPNKAGLCRNGVRVFDYSVVPGALLLLHVVEEQAARKNLF